MTAGAATIVSVQTTAGSTVRAVVALDAGARLGDGDPVVVQADGLPVLGFVVLPPAPLPATAASEDCRVVRRATPQDLRLRQRHEQRERDAQRVASMKIRERGLCMKLIRVEQTFDGAKLVFYFTADERVDFRELVRELAAEYKTRIELRQIGVRDEARLVSGFGTCGRELCCSAFLRTFDPVSIKMAKVQDLALNPARLSGLCGRLKCCLRFELPPSQLSATRNGGDEVCPAGRPDGACARARRRPDDEPPPGPARA